MPYCNICGDEKNIRYYPAQRAYLCPACQSDTPRKVSREAFDLAYWGKDHADQNESIKREFYADYKASTATLENYIEQTTTKEED